MLLSAVTITTVQLSLELLLMFLYTVSMQKSGRLPRKKSFSIDLGCLELSLRRRCLPNARQNRTGKLALATLLLSGAFAATALAQSHAPRLIPLPRELHAGDLVPVASATVVVTPSNEATGNISGSLSEDLFTAQDLTQNLADAGIRMAPAIGLPDLTITLFHRETPQAKQLLTDAKLAFDPAMHDEGYILIARPHQVSLIADTSTGLFYAAQTLKQLVERGSSNQSGASIWTGTIRDWPAMKYRGIDDDLSRGPFPTLAFQKHQIQTFAAYKVNVYSPYFEHTVQYAADPLAAPPGSSLTRAESQELAAFAARYHIIIVPEQEAFGHLHHILQYEEHTDLAETPHGHVLAPGQLGTQPLILSWFTQLAQDFPSPFLHVGADETDELGTGRTKADVDKRGLGPVYAGFLSEIHTTLAPLNRRLLFWGDVATSDPTAIDHLPKDMIAIPWIYWHLDNYDSNILPFKRAGMETWVAPGDANWSLVYPNAATALDNIQGFVAAGQRLGSTGELLTVWNDDGEGLFNQDWFGVLFGAAAAWQPGTSDIPAYQHAFGHTFFGDSSGKVDRAQQELMIAETFIDPSDEYFWSDPWTPAGQVIATKIRPKLHDGRLHAEQALELIQQARAEDPNLRESAALDAMELGARRIDLTGLKFQLSDEMSLAYARAYALKEDPKHANQAADLLYSIGSNNGRCQDLRDAYSMTKNLYRQSWLAENRPYWLDNVLVRYDLRIQLWQNRGEHIDALINAWQDSKVFPTPEQVGLPPTPPQP
jgi:hexosaminidase